MSDSTKTKRKLGEKEDTYKKNSSNNTILNKKQKLLNDLSSHQQQNLENNEGKFNFKALICVISL